MELQQEENQNCTDDTVIFQGKGGGGVVGIYKRYQNNSCGV